MSYPTPNESAAVYWLRRRLELDRAADRVSRLAFSAPRAADPVWRDALDGAARALSIAVRVADERAIRLVPDEERRRHLRDVAAMNATTADPEVLR